jgi:hypothetical protein
MESPTVFPMRFDRPSRTPMSILGAGPKASRVTVSTSTVDVSMGWAFGARFALDAIASVRSVDGGLNELPGPLGLSVLRGVNYWRRTALVNGAGSGLVEITLKQSKWARLGPLKAPMRRLIVSVEDPSALLAALAPAS